MDNNKEMFDEAINIVNEINDEKLKESYIELFNKFITEDVIYSDKDLETHNEILNKLTASDVEIDMAWKYNRLKEVLFEAAPVDFVDKMVDFMKNKKLEQKEPISIQEENIQQNNKTEEEILSQLADIKSGQNTTEKNIKDAKQVMDFVQKQNEGQLNVNSDIEPISNETQENIKIDEEKLSFIYPEGINIAEEIEDEFEIEQNEVENNIEQEEINVINEEIPVKTIEIITEKSKENFSFIDFQSWKEQNYPNQILDAAETATAYALYEKAKDNAWKEANVIVDNFITRANDLNNSYETMSEPVQAEDEIQGVVKSEDNTNNISEDNNSAEKTSNDAKNRKAILADTKAFYKDLKEYLDGKPLTPDNIAALLRSVENLDKLAGPYFYNDPEMIALMKGTKNTLKGMALEYQANNLTGSMDNVESARAQTNTAEVAWEEPVVAVRDEHLEPQTNTVEPINIEPQQEEMLDEETKQNLAYVLEGNYDNAEAILDHLQKTFDNPNDYLTPETLKELGEYKFQDEKGENIPQFIDDQGNLHVDYQDGFKLNPNGELYQLANTDKESVIVSSLGNKVKDEEIIKDLNDSILMTVETSLYMKDAIEKGLNDDKSGLQIQIDGDESNKESSKVIKPETYVAILGGKTAETRHYADFISKKTKNDRLADKLLDFGQIKEVENNTPTSFKYFDKDFITKTSKSSGYAALFAGGIQLASAGLAAAGIGTGAVPLAMTIGLGTSVVKAGIHYKKWHKIQKETGKPSDIKTFITDKTNRQMLVNTALLGGTVAAFAVGLDGPATVLSAAYIATGAKNGFTAVYNDAIEKGATKTQAVKKAVLNAGLTFVSSMVARSLTGMGIDAAVIDNVEIKAPIETATSHQQAGEQAQSPAQQAIAELKEQQTETKKSHPIPEKTDTQEAVQKSNEVLEGNNSHAVSDEKETSKPKFSGLAEGYAQPSVEPEIVNQQYIEKELDRVSKENDKIVQDYKTSLPVGSIFNIQNLPENVKEDIIKNNDNLAKIARENQLNAEAIHGEGSKEYKEASKSRIDIENERLKYENPEAYKLWRNIPNPYLNNNGGR